MAVVAKSGYYPAIYVEELTKAMKNLGNDSNRATLENKPRVFTTTTSGFVLLTNLILGLL
jgi:hypothetical protein